MNPQGCPPCTGNCGQGHTCPALIAAEVDDSLTWWELLLYAVTFVGVIAASVFMPGHWWAH